MLQYRLVYITTLVLCILLLLVAYPNQQEAAEDYATALGISPSVITMVFDDGPAGEEEWNFPGGCFDLDSATGAFHALSADENAPFNENTSAVSTDAQAIARADAFISAYASGLGLPLPGQDDTASVTTSPLTEGRWVDYQPTVGGLRAYPHWMVQVADSGAVLTFGYAAPNGTLPSATPDVTVQQAVSIVATETGDQLQLTDSELMYTLGDNDVPYLVWYLQLNGQAHDYTVEVDAHSGDILVLMQSMDLREKPQPWEAFSAEKIPQLILSPTVPKWDSPAPFQPVTEDVARPGLSLPALAVGAVAATLSLVVARAFQR